MKAVIAAVVLALAMLCSPAAKAWNCSDPLAERVLVPAGTAGTFGDGDGQLANFNGQLFECKVVPPSTPQSGGVSATNTNTNNNSSNSNSSSTSGANSTSNSGSTSSATGGKSSSTSTATGGNATGGNAAGGNSSSGVSNSGNSTSTNNNTANGGQGGTGGSATATGGNQKQTQSSNSSASNNGNGANNSTYSSVTRVDASKIPVATALAPPVYPTATCFKGFSAAAQSMAFGASFGGGKIDTNCAILEAARAAKNRLAFCKVYVSNKYVKAAGVSLADCMEEEVIAVEQGPATVVPEPIPAPIQPIVINVPTPVVQVIAAVPPQVVAAPTPTAPVIKKKKHVVRPCVPKACPPTKPVVWNEDMVEKLGNGKS